MPSLKYVPAIGTIPTATSVPSRPCFATTPDELIRCNLAGHAKSVRHSGYDPGTNTTVTW